MALGGQLESRARLVDHPVRSRRAAHRRAMFVLRPRYVQAHGVGKARRVRLPADPRDRETLLHQESVAPIDGLPGVQERGRAEGLPRAVHAAEDQPPPPVRNVDDCGATPLRRVDRLQHAEVPACPDEALLAPWREGEVHHARVRRVPGIESEMHAAFDQLVADRVAARGRERVRREQRHPAFDVDAEHAGLRRWRRQDRGVDDGADERGEGGE